MRCNRHDAAHYHKCERCGKEDVKKPKRFCGRCIDTTKFKVVELRPGNRGRNKVGIASKKPDRSRTKTKKHRVSFPPKEVTAYSYDMGRS